MPLSDPPAPSLPGVAQTNGCTAVIAVAELLDETGSAGAEAVIDAVFEIGKNPAGAYKKMVMVSMQPTASTPMVHATIAIPEHVTRAGTAEPETNVVVIEMVSLNF